MTLPAIRPTPLLRQRLAPELLARIAALVARDLDGFLLAPAVEGPAAASPDGAAAARDATPSPDGALDRALARALHARQRAAILQRDQAWIRRALARHAARFASGAEVDPARVQPRLVEVVEPWQADLFRLARYTWSLPYTKGYGRRLRFLIVDASNDKLIGLVGLQSPPLDFAPRDRRFRYPPGRKEEIVNQTLDAFVVGGVPPYSDLLGGKLAVLALASRELAAAYTARYGGRRSLLRERALDPTLLAITTTSAYGRSSLYNRVIYQDGPRRVLVAEPLGLLRGRGAFHISDELYRAFKAVVQAEQPERRLAGFGSGPRVKWQVATIAARRLGLGTLLSHGIRRQAYLVALVEEIDRVVAGEAPPLPRHWPFADLARYWRTRWLLPRAERAGGQWQTWQAGPWLESLLTARPAP